MASSRNELLAPLKTWAKNVVDTTESYPRELRVNHCWAIFRPRTGPVFPYRSHVWIWHGIPIDADLVLMSARQTHTTSWTRNQTGGGSLFATMWWIMKSLSFHQHYCLDWAHFAKLQGKKASLFLTIAVGCTGGQQSQCGLCKRIVEDLAKNWPVNELMWQRQKKGTNKPFMRNQR